MLGVSDAPGHHNGDRRQFGCEDFHTCASYAARAPTCPVITTGFGSGYARDLRVIKPPIPDRVATDFGPKFINPRLRTDPRPLDFDAPDPAKTRSKPICINAERKKCARSTQTLFKMLVALPALLKAPRGPLGEVY
jgi:hypothetical protein